MTWASETPASRPTARQVRAGTARCAMYGAGSARSPLPPTFSRCTPSGLFSPSIDALAQSGVVLSSFYVQSACTPTRAALLTGLYPMRTGMQDFVIKQTAPNALPSSFTLLPQYLKQVGQRSSKLATSSESSPFDCLSGGLRNCAGGKVASRVLPEGLSSAAARLRPILWHVHGRCGPLHPGCELEGLDPGLGRPSRRERLRSGPAQRKRAATT
mmetsp:Transcript_15332/g.40515  ORF Transcript_15332/g.40515 Transcript_15332/m.40515 type:complete len:214 (-) Transcript_15332:1660-2301(-)